MRKTVLIGVAAVGLVGAIATSASAYATFDKAVTLSVDGKPRTIHTFGSTVADVLAAENLRVSAHDVVAPALSSKVEDGARIAVRFSRPLTLTVNGNERTHRVTALSIDGALRQLGVRYEGAELSASRSVGIGRKGLDLDVKTFKDLKVVHDGHWTRIGAPALTVGDALREADIDVDKDDKVSPPLTEEVGDGQTIRVVRVERKKMWVRVAIPYDKVRKADSSMYEDQSKVQRNGRSGVRSRVVHVLLVDGERKYKKVLSQQTLRKPVAQIELYGTKDRPAPASDDGGSGGGGPVGGGVDSLNWAALADCESGGDPQAVNPAGYYGLYQFTVSTWSSVGGSGIPIDNSAGEQTYRAKLLYQREGSAPWPVCGSQLFS